MKSQALQEVRSEPIAVVGLACSLPPDIETADEMWNVLAEGKVITRAFEESRLRNSFLNSQANTFTRAASLFDTIDQFAPHFFRISPREAKALDPQQRLLLEVTWRALEDAALAMSALRGARGGVFIGLSSDDYAHLRFSDEHDEHLDRHLGTGTHRSMAAGRIAYFLDWHGPVIQLDTACSSSLVAVHTACQSLRMHESDIALAGGVHLLLDPKSIVARGKLNVLSSDGTCKPFSATADGFGMGEGAGIIVLKRAADALRDGDRIVGIIRGSAVNHNGYGPGLIAPNLKAQQAVMIQALESAGLQPSVIDYVEAHGTGTLIGDPIEISSLASVYGERALNCPVWVGSVKGNFGHLEAAAGIISLIKVLVAFDKGLIPPSVPCNTLNPNIPWQNLPFKLPAQIMSWPEHTEPKRAAVSSFGMSGTNCNLIVESAKTCTNAYSSAHQGPFLFVITAQSAQSLQVLARKYLQALDGSSYSLGDFCWTLCVGRTHFRERVAFATTTKEHAASKLLGITNESTTPEIIKTTLTPSIDTPTVGLLIRRPENLMDLTSQNFVALDPSVSKLLQHTKDILGRGQQPRGRSDKTVTAFIQQLAFATLWQTWVNGLRIIPADKLGTHVAHYLDDNDIDQLHISLDELDSQRDMEMPWNLLDLSGIDILIDLGGGSINSGFDLPPILYGCSAERFGMLETAAKLFAYGANLNWAAIQAGPHNKLSLPTYPFERLPMSDSTNGIRGYENKDDEEVGGKMPDKQYLEILITEIRSFVARLLETQEQNLDISEPLLQMGADSLVLVEIIRFIKEKFKVPINLRQLFEELLTIEAIATFIADSSTSDTYKTEGDLTKVQQPMVKTEQALLTPSFQETSDSSNSDTRNLSGVLTHDRVSVNNQSTITMKSSFHKTADSYQDSIASASSERQLTSKQQNCIQTIVNRFLDKTPLSRKEAWRVRSVLCNNRRSLSVDRPEMSAIHYPIRAARSMGAHFHDIDNNEYVDLSMGFGVHLFGHNPEFLIDRLNEQLSKGVHLGPESDLVAEVAEGIAGLTDVERVLFCNSGTEAVMTAIRIARAASGRKKIAIFRNAYHGHFDGTLVIPGGGIGQVQARPMTIGIPHGMVEDVIVLPFDSPQALKIIEEEADSLAAVLVEPVQNRRPDIHPGPFLKDLRELTSRHGVLLIFDEILIGFRIHPGGGQAWFGIKADLVTYAKILGGGMPIGVVAGKSSYMNHVDGGFSMWGPGDPPPVDTIYTAGTYCKHPLGMSAAKAILEEMTRIGPSLQSGLNNKTDEFVGTLNAEFNRMCVPLQAFNFGSFFRFAQSGNLSFVYQPLEMDLFNAGMISRGTYIVEGGTAFLSVAHNASDIDYVIESAVSTVKELQEGGFWPEPPTKPTSYSGSEKYSTTGKSESSHTGVNRLANNLNYVSVRSSSSQERPNTAQSHQEPNLSVDSSRINFGVSYFGSYALESSAEPYKLLLQSAKLADDLQFHALWFPERHFHEFGALSPNPSVIAAAISQGTSRIRLRAGSVVAALHHPVRVAEEWAVVDQLSNGRVEVAFASGWHSNDFIFAPDLFASRREVMDRNIETIRKLWEGNSVRFRNGAGQDIDIALFPRPVQPKLPIWLASLNSIETFEKAGKIGANVLTNLITQDLGELQERISAYRRARKEAGYNPEEGRVALLLHTMVGESDAKMRQIARNPLRQYLASSVDLSRQMARGEHFANLDHLDVNDRNYMLDRALDRYIAQNSLIGSIDSCNAMVERLVKLGVDEFACFIDFGADPDQVLASLEALDQLRRQWLHPKKQTLASSSPERILTLADRRSNQPPAELQRDATAGSILPTTPNQRLLWLASKFDRNAACAYVVRTTIELDGTLNIEALESALQRVVQRHAALRCSFPDEDGEIQHLDNNLIPEIPIIDFSFLPQEAQTQEIERWYKDDALEPIDLEKGPMFRVTLLRLASSLYRLIINVHHIIYDGISEQILIREFGELYSAECRQASSELPTSVDYIQYVQLHAKWDNAYSEQERYWTGKLKDLPHLKLPFDHPLPQMRTFHGNRVHFALDPDCVHAAKQIAIENHTTPYILLLSIYTSLLHELTDQSDVLVGILVANRESKEMDGLIGFCSNMVPIRSRLSAGSSVIQHLLRIREAVFEASENQAVPWARIIEIASSPDWSAAPITSTCFNWDRVKYPNFDNLKARTLPDPATYVRFPLSLNVVERDGNWELEWDYNSDLFERSTIDKIANRYFKLLTDMTSRGISLVAHSTGAKVTTANTLLKEMRARCKDRTESIAVSDEYGQLTYAELELASDAVAERLLDENVKPGDLVALHIPQSKYSIVCLLGIWKTGAAFVPLNVESPEHYNRKLVDKVRAKVVITSRNTCFNDPSGAYIFIEDLPKAPARKISSYEPSPDDLAYVTLTSGSTGKPKAVAVEHRNLMSYVNSIIERADLNITGKYLLVSPLHVDLGYTMIFPPLIGGGTLYVSSRETARDPDKLASFNKLHGIEYLKISPTHLDALLDHPQGIDILPNKTLIIGGERLRWELVDHIQAISDINIINHYGPAEGTVGVATYSVQREDSWRKNETVPIGKPLGQAQFDIINSDDTSIQSGIIGELVISGPSVSRGYLNDHLNSGAFEFGNGCSFSRYRTGDRVQKLPDGNYTFIGRLDDQVKIRGYRVELGDVVQAITSHPAVSTAEVVAKTIDDKVALIACIVLCPEKSNVSTSDIRHFLETRVPDYMIPNTIEIINKLPIASSGKTDRAAIMSMSSGRKDSLLGDDREEKMIMLWQEVFGISTIHMNSDFFELGGQSIQAIKLVSRLKRVFGVNIGVRSLFDHSTPEQLINYVEQKSQTAGVV